MGRRRSIDRTTCIYNLVVLRVVAPCVAVCAVRSVNFRGGSGQHDVTPYEDEMTLKMNNDDDCCAVCLEILPTGAASQLATLRWSLPCHETQLCLSCMSVITLGSNPKCPLCRRRRVLRSQRRTPPTHLPQRHSRSLVQRFRAYCTTIERTILPNEQCVLQQIDQHIANNGCAYIHYAYIPKPYHVAKLTASDCATVCFEWYPQYNTVLLKHDGAYYRQGVLQPNASSSRNIFWLHSIIDVSCTRARWYDDGGN